MTALLTPDSSRRSRIPAGARPSRHDVVTPIAFPGAVARRAATGGAALRVAAARPEARPRLTVIEGGRSAAGRSEQRTFRARRLGLVAALAVVAVLLWGLVSLGSAPPAASHGSAPAVTSSHYLVRPGDSLWGIAKALHRGGDLRDTVDELAAANGSDTVVAGERITIPADLLG